MSSASGTDRASYVRKVIVRNPDALFFTVALPLLFLVVYVGLDGGQHFHELGQPGKITMYARLVASVIVMTVVSGAFADLTIFLVRDREQGVLKRLRSTPVPTGVFLGGHLVNAMLTSMVPALLVGTLGWAAYGGIPARRSRPRRRRDRAVRSARMRRGGIRPDELRPHA